GQVIVKTPELSAQVESMAVRFRHLDPQEALRAGYTVSESNLKSKTAIRSQPVSPAPVSPPVLAAPSLPASPTTPKLPLPRSQAAQAPMSITGKTLEADIVRIGSESVIENLSLEGSFTLLREFLSAESPWPLSATGD
ncbi:MAG: hypothetical protein ACK48K_00925, partial [Planctomycetota bacterium]